MGLNSEKVLLGKVGERTFEAPPDYKSRNKNFFRLNQQQKWDYFIYRRYCDRRHPELVGIRQKQRARENSKQDTLKKYHGGRLKKK